MVYKDPGWRLRLPQKEKELNYLQSDFLVEQEEDETEAEVPVPDRLLPRSKYQQIVAKLRLSQKIGILLWLNREGVITVGGRQRLLYLQEKASFEAISAGVKFAERLTNSEKLQSDFKHAARELNRRPQSKRFRIAEKRRIGIGYRDKGTLPGNASSARRKATEDSFVPSSEISRDVLNLLKQVVPNCLTEDEDWVDLAEVTEGLRSLENLQDELRSLLSPL